MSMHKALDDLKHSINILEANNELWKWFDTWVRQTLPADALKRSAMIDPVRVVSRLKDKSDAATVVDALEKLRIAIEEEGLDRHLERPYSIQPSVKDLKLVAWELVVGPEGVAVPQR